MEKFDEILSQKLKGYESALPEALWSRIEVDVFDPIIDVDEVIATKMQTYESPVPATLWSRIESGIHIAKPISNTKRYLLLGLLALISTVGILFYTQQTKITLPANSVEENHQADNRVQKNKSEIQQTDIKSRQDDTSNRNAFNVNIKEDSEIDKNRNVSESIPVFTSTKISKADRNEGRVKALFDNNIESKIRNTDTQLSEPVSRQQTEQNSSYTTEYSSAQSNEVRSNAANDISYDVSQVQERTAIFLQDIEALQMSELIYNMNHDIEPLSIILNTSSRGRLSIDLLAGIDMPLQSLSVLDNDQQGYLFSRNNTEVNSTSWTAGIRISYDLSRSISLRSGLIVQQYSVKFNFSDLNANKEFELVDESTGETFTFDANGQRDVQEYTTYRSYAVPVQMGLHRNLNKLQVSFNPGVLFHLTNTVTGKNLDQSAHVRVVDNTSGLYTSKVSMSLIGSIGLAYPIGSNMDILFEPNVRYNLSSIQSLDNPIRERFSSYGILSGLRYRF